MVMLRTFWQRLGRRISGRYFYKLMSLGLLSVVIPIMLISFFSYRITVNNMEEQSYQARLDMLAQLQSRVDERLETARKALFALVFDSDIAWAAHMDSAALGPQQLLDAQGKLSLLAQSVEDSYGVSIYFIDSGTSLFNDRFIKQSDQWWASDFPKHVSVGEWHYQEGTGFRVVTRTIALPAMSEEPRAYLSIHLHQRAFAGILQDIDFIEAADVYFLDSGLHPILARIQGEVQPAQAAAAMDWIRSSSKPYDMRSDAASDVLAQFVRSGSTGWSTAFIVPLSSQSAFTAKIVWVSLLVSLLALAAGIVLNYFTSRRLYAPIRQWLLDENDWAEDPKRDEWSWLRSRWKTLKEDLQRNEPELREAFLNALIGGYYQHARKEAEALMERHQLPHDRKCVVFVVDPGNFAKYGRFESGDNLLVHMSIANIFKELLERSYLSGDSLRRPETYQSVLLVYFPREMEEEKAYQLALQLAQSLIHSIETYLKFSATLGLGGIRPSVFGLRESYGEAKGALQYRIVRENESVLDYRDIRQVDDRLNYPFDISEKIVQELRSGNRDGAASGFREFVELVRSRNVPDREIRQMFLMLYEATLQSFYQYSKQTMAELSDWNGHERIRSAQSLSEIEEWFRASWFPYCFEVIGQENESRGKQVIETVKRYIRMSLDQDHSLQLVAEQVNLNPSYLSRLFRKETGQSFVQYVAEVKIEEAKRLLEQTSDPIYRIAEQVGYTEQTFRRVFKSQTNMSPNEYRNSLRK